MLTVLLVRHHFYLSRTSGYPERSGVYLQCHAVYTVGTLQPMQCTCSIGCSYTADTLQTEVYTAGTLLLHCKYTVGTLHSAVNTANTLQNGLLCQHFFTLHIHCQQVAVYLQCTCSLHCSYTVCTLHFGLGYHRWAQKM